MIILVPFMILKLRRSIEKKRTDENMEALRTLILDDIIELIRENQEVGNITAADARRLHDLIHKLYNHLYSHYDEFIEGGLNDMMEDGLILETDIIEAELTKKITKRVTEEVTEQVTKEVTEQVTKEVTEQVTKEVTEQVTKEVTEQVTKEVTEQLANETAKREKRIQEKAIRKLYLKLGDINEIAECLDIPVDKVKSLLENETVM